MDNAGNEKTISSELERADKFILKLEKRFYSLSKAGLLTRIQRETIYNQMMIALLFLGDLNADVDMNEIRINYEKKARKEFPHSEKKARTSFLKVYEAHTEPFDKLKERCWRIIDRVAVQPKK